MKLIWVVKIDLIQVWGIGIDFDCSVDIGIDLVFVWEYFFCL